ncbi:MAG: DUF389 domain-containing protein [Chloroflexi bacterium]|nr:DUF389 domain-containing protein [Chloroflexota bacterium]
MDDKQDRAESSGQEKPPAPPEGLRAHIRHHYRRLRKFLNITETRKAIVRSDLLESSAPREEFYALILFASAIATFGLIANAEVVAIGSQLVDPLMSPILGLAIAADSGLQRMFRRAMQSILWGLVISILLSVLISFFFYRLPYGPTAAIPETVISRTSATLLDLGIALVGGCAAAYSMAHPRLEGAIPGVAIATALMPPLCTIGFGIAFLDTGIILGAVLQFLTNLTAILFAGIMTFKLLGFNPLQKDEQEDVSRRTAASLIVVLVISLLLAIFTWNTVQDARVFDRVRRMIIRETGQFSEVELIDLSIIKDGRNRRITTTLRTSNELSETEAGILQDRLSELLDRDVTLELIAVPIQIINPNSSSE